jgi:hypothetical protein
MEHANNKKIHTYIHTFIHTHIHTYIRKYVHTYTHTYMHTYTYEEGKMTDEVCQDIESELNKISSTTDQSGNMRKGLKKIICESVSKLRNFFTKIKVMNDESIRQ